MRVVGLMSGTSMDGLDAAVADLEWDGGAVAMAPRRHIERPWPDEVRARLHASLGPTTAGELCQLDQLIGSTRRRAARPAGRATRTAGSPPAAGPTGRSSNACSTSPTTRSCRPSRPAASTFASATCRISRPKTCWRR
jgi:hypothetical protein